MADRYDRDPADYTYETDGGEATPRPLRSQRLVDVMGDSSKGKGRTRPAKAGRPRSEGATVTPRRTVDKPSAAQPSVHTKAAVTPVETENVALNPSPDAYAVLSVTPAGEGECVNVVLAIPAPVGGKAQRVSFYLLVEQYAELGVKVGPITSEETDTLLEAGRLCGAIRRGMAMLGYGDQSARRLAYKLTAKGVERATADAAAAYLTAKGYVREDSAATLRAEQGLRKGWGERRIREDLCAHGFTREAVEEAMESLSDVDWKEQCAAAIRKKYGEVPEDRGERQKLVAAMMRLGYDADTVKAAMRELLREN